MSKISEIRLRCSRNYESLDCSSSVKGLSDLNVEEQRQRLEEMFYHMLRSVYDKRGYYEFIDYVSAMEYAGERVIEEYGRDEEA